MKVLLNVTLKRLENKINRQVRYKLRQFKYVYVENKFLINTIGAIALVIIAFVIYFNIGVYTASYSQGSSFSASGVVMNVKDTYLTQEDPLGNSLTDDMILVVKVDIKSQGGINQTLNTGLATVRIDDKSYGQDVNYAKELYDLGSPYTSQELTDEFKSYILTFLISKEDINKKMILKFNDNVSYVKGEIGAKNILVTLNPTNLSENVDGGSKKLGEEESFNDSILGTSSLKINSFEVGDKFQLSYKYCYGTDKCIDSTEYVTPTATGNYFKTLMKINADFSIDQNINSSEISTFVSFLNTFGTINYKVNDNWSSTKINTQSVKPKVAKDNNNYYIEVPSEVKNASEINFTFKIRNYIYKYVLK